MSALVKQDAKSSQALAGKQTIHPDARIKVVVRRLPPNLPENIFWDSVAPWVNETTCMWKLFVQGKIRKGVNKENLPSRAYIGFRTQDLLVQFSAAYDGHIFRDKQGNESEAIVEYAPFHKIPSDKKKVDQRAGTIHEDEDFLSFVETLNKGEAAETEATTSVPLEEPTTMTPLLAALLAEKSAAKDKEAILRNHAHYQATGDTTSSRKQKAKEKALEAAEFSRKPADITKPPPDKASKGQAKSINSTKPTDQSQAQKKHKASQKTPASPIKPPKAKSASAMASTEDPSPAGTTLIAQDTAAKSRPKFKFDGALASAKPRTNAGSNQQGGPEILATAIPQQSLADSDQPQASRKQRQKEKVKEKAREEGQVATSSGGATSSQGVGLTAAPKILLRNAARIDDDESLAPAPSSAGIIPLIPRGRGRGAGRGAGRGRGRGAPTRTEVNNSISK